MTFLDLARATLLAAHLLAVNVAAAGPLLLPLIQWNDGRGGSPTWGRIGRSLAWVCLAGAALGGLLGLTGGCLLWAIDDLRFFQVLDRLERKVFHGLLEIAFYALCLGVYLAWWRWRTPRAALARAGHAVLALAAATNLLWHFPPLMTLLAHPGLVKPEGGLIGAGEFRALMFQDVVMSQCLHVWLACLATSGLALAWLAERELRAVADADRAAARGLIAWGGRVALAATLLQIPAGAWLLIATPKIEQLRLLGDSVLATGLLGGSLMLGLVLLHQLSSLALASAGSRDGDPPTASRALFTLAAIVLAMCLTLRAARQGAVTVDELPRQEAGRARTSPRNNTGRIAFGRCGENCWQCLAATAPPAAYRP